MSRNVRYAWPLSMFCLVALGGVGCRDGGDTGSDQVERAPLTAHARWSGAPAALSKKMAPAPTASPANRGPGQIIVKFKASGPQSVTEDAQTWLRQRRSFATATADGSPSLDAVLARHQVRDARPLVRDRAGLSTSAATTMVQTRLSRFAAARGLRVPPAAASNLVNVYRLDIGDAASTTAAVAELQQDPHVEYAQPNYEMRAVYTPNDPFLATTGSWGQAEADLWGLKKMATETAWNTARGAGIVVAVVDTGVDFSHPDIAPNAWVNTNEIPGNGIDDDHNGYIDDRNGWSTATDSNDPTDRFGHGTHVAGTIAAQDNNGLGVVGVAPDAQIMAVKGLGDGGSGSSFDLAEALLYAGANGARVVNNSWGCSQGCPSNPVVEDAVTTLHNNGVVVVFAAGNDTKDVKLYSPQNHPEPIVVSAATPLDALASFSNFGFVDVAAPGAGTPNQAGVTQPDRGILSLKSAVCDPAICPPELIVGGSYLRQAGTSMATPHVSGLAALILSQKPTYTVEDVRQVIRRSSRDLGTAGFDPQFGYGFVSASAAVTQPVPLRAWIATGPRVETAKPFAVTGTAAGTGFLSYLLEYGAGAAPTTFTAIASSSTQVSNATLGTWATAPLADGEYTLRLTARTTDGRVYEDRNLVVLDRVSISSPAPLSFNGSNGTPIQIRGTAALGNLDHFAIRVQRLLDGSDVTGLNITLAGGGRTPVENGLLATWNPAGAPADDYRIILEVTPVGAAVQTDSVPVLVDTAIHPGWPVVLDNGGENIPFFDSHGIVADLDGDHRDEHIVAYARQVNVFKHDGTQLGGWPQRVNPHNEPTGVLLDGPAVGDVNGDGKPDVVVSSLDGNLWVWNANGTLQSGWPRLVGTPGATHDVTLADVDGDGKLDILVADGAGQIHIRRGTTGASLPGWPVSTGGGLSGGVTAADLDKNGSVEIVASLSTGGPYGLVAYTSAGVLLPGFPVSVATTSSSGAYPVVGDIDDDGDLEIVVSAAGFSDSTAARVAAYHHTGQPVAGWPKSVSAIQMSPPVLADLDGDGSLEVIVGASDGRGALYVWNGAGALMPGWPVFTPDTVLFTVVPFLSPIVFNADADHRNELVVVRTEDNFLTGFAPFGKPIQAFKYNGVPIPELQRPQFGNIPTGAWDLAPALGDTDGDGKLEMVWLDDRSQVTGERFADAWDLNVSATTNVPWRMPRADARRSATAQAVVPIKTLTAPDRDTPQHVDGLGRFRITTGQAGIIQIARGWQPATIQWAAGSDPLQNTTFDWGGQMQLSPNTTYLVRVQTTGGPSDVRLSWW